MGVSQQMVCLGHILRIGLLCNSEESMSNACTISDSMYEYSFLSFSARISSPNNHFEITTIKKVSEKFTILRLTYLTCR